MAVKAVILDLDDTLCLTEAVCFDLENAVLEKIGHPKMLRAVHKANWGKPLFEAILERAPGVDIAAFRKEYVSLNQLWVKSAKFDAIPKENFAALDELIGLDFSLVILTSRTHEELAHLLEPDHDLATRIEAFYYRDNMQFHKPDPRAFAHIEATHSWSPQECVYVGDSIGDAEASTGAGMHFIASLESGLRSKEDFAKYPQTVFINNFTEVVQAVQVLNQRLQ